MASVSLHQADPTQQGQSSGFSPVLGMRHGLSDREYQCNSRISMGLFLFALVFLTVWIPSGVCAGNVAQDKGHGFGNWALAGFLFGPVGLLGAVGLPDRKLRRMETLRLALEADREATLKVTKLDEVVSKYSASALERKEGKDGSKYKDANDLFLNWLERLF